MVPLARTHRVEVGQRGRHGVKRPRGEGGRERVIGVALTLANRQRLGQTQQIAGRQRACDQPPRARLVERRLEGTAELLVELDIHARGRPEL